MPVLKNTRHEKFAQELAKGKTADEAYVSAGYKENRKNAHRLKTNEDVSRRLAELQEIVAEKAIWTVEERIQSLKEIHDRAMISDGRTAIAAIAEVNKMEGAYAPTKRELSGPDGGPINTKSEPAIDLSRLTDEELAAYRLLTSAAERNREGN